MLSLSQSLFEEFSTCWNVERKGFATWPLSNLFIYIIFDTCLLLTIMLQVEMHVMHDV